MQTGGASISQDIFCQDCGYNLRTLTGNRCPECGRSLEGLRSSVSQIPWVHRKEIGRFRAYWKTVWFVMFRQRQFCDEMIRPVSYSDSQKFRWTTVGATVLFVLSTFVTAYMALPRSYINDPVEAAMAAVFPVVILFIGLVLWISAITGVPSYFFHPKSVDISQQNRAIALSYYSCGPLVLVGLPLLALNAAMILHHFDEATSLLFLILAITLPLGPIAAWWLDLIHLSRRLLPQRPSRAVWVAVLVPLFWVILGGLLAVALPALLFYPFLIFYSLQQ